MHLPLLLVQDSVLKTKTPLPNLHWIGKDGRQVCSLSPQLVREVDLPSGSCSKVAKLTPHTRTAAAISVTHDGVFVYGILSSGELFFWHTATNQLRQAKGIPEVVTPTTNPPESNVVREFFKPLLPQSFGSNVASDGAEQAACSAAAHLRPKVFASSSCSKVVVVLGASQVYVWERSVGCQMEDCSVSQHVPGSWSVAECPADVPLPNTHSKETQISCCFMYEESSEECHISFTFVESCCVVVSTLVLGWQGLRGHLPAAHWHPLVVSFSALGVRENELPHLKGALISSSLRSQWVSDLTWTHDNLYLVGCLRSGALFIATRMGSLIKISCQGEGIQLQPANILGIQPHSTMPSDEVAEEEGNTNPRGPPSLTFCVSSHPRKHQVLLSSGFRASVLSLPLEGRKEGEVVDCLLSSATHALHLLCNSAVTHDYAYIRDSTWRLAHSVLDLTQGLTTTSSPNSPKV
ncbi:Protein JBTS17 [Chionoecetes opilio]|uniref:Protein JBTS17 n=1 Tax=Chionoecetes opilio TaxID=41210 RepID=A0A8J5CR55_CHIOP|nr:Protein JBTS17 [Chionoecetes opilio]